MKQPSRKTLNEFMRECFRLAKKGRGYVSPNPLVGAVLVRGNRIVAKGYHRRFGGPHAEVDCLRRYKGSTSDLTLYVNLEPCTFYAKTPPCVDLIIQRGIENVVVAMKDPNPLVAGKGITKLRRAGINVVLGVLEDQAQHQNKFFTKHIGTGLPYVHVKIAQTKDGFISSGKGPMVYVTSLASRRVVHRWRTEYDAVLVGAGTVRADNPDLTVRLATGRDPAVVILDGRLKVSGRERVFDSATRRKVIVCTSNSSPETKKLMLRRKGITVLEFPMINKYLKLRTVLRALCENGIGSILVEGGREVFSQFMNQNLLDEVSIFSSPSLYGSGVISLTDEASVRMKTIFEQNHFRSYQVGKDILMTGRIH